MLPFVRHRSQKKIGRVDLTMIISYHRKGWLLHQLHKNGDTHRDWLQTPPSGEAISLTDEKAWENKQVSLCTRKMQEATAPRAEVLPTSKLNEGSLLSGKEDNLSSDHMVIWERWVEYFSELSNKQNIGNWEVPWTERDGLRKQSVQSIGSRIVGSQKRIEQQLYW